MIIKTEFKEKYENLLKTDYLKFITGFELERSYGLRINTLKTKDILTNSYLKSILTLHPLVKDGYYYDKNRHPGRHPYHHAGVYYIQDPSAMMVVENADILENDIVFDMCAAPGGKSTHVLSKLNQTGLLITNEIIPKRAKILSENIERMGAKNAVVINTDPENLNKEFYGYFDKVIVDAPCSGEGMFRKDEDACNQWNQEYVVTCSILQNNLLDIAYKLVKQNGIIIYSTCTFSPEENEQVIAKLLKKYNDLVLLPTIKSPQIENGNPEFCDLNEIETCSRFYFHRYNGEGHFIAKIKKTSESESYKKTKAKSLKKATNQQIQLFSEFKERYLINFDSNKAIYDFNNHLYLLDFNEQLPNLDYLSILRYGLHLGEIKKNRFEPSHSLALSLKKDQAKQVINFDADSPEIIKYLKGETINFSGNSHYTLITVDDFPIGWAKQVDNVLKNHYPKGLRIK